MAFFQRIQEGLEPQDGLAAMIRKAIDKPLKSKISLMAHRTRLCWVKSVLATIVEIREQGGWGLAASMRKGRRSACRL